MPSSSHWRVFYTRARAEKKCETRLQERGIDVLVPKKTEIRQWSDRKKEVTVPLFRNYLFARVDEKDRLRTLKTNGIVRCVHFDGTPARLRPDTVEQLKKTQQAPDRLSVADLRPPVGETVTITDGPMQGLTGEVTQHRGQTYLLVRVEAIQQGVKVEVPADWVTTAERAS
ncbi:MAG: UpxY family transcription antiterminator [Salinibacter sp.]